MVGSTIAYIILIFRKGIRFEAIAIGMEAMAIRMEAIASFRPLLLVGVTFIAFLHLQGRAGARYGSPCKAEGVVPGL